MPSPTFKAARFMAMADHDPAFAKRNKVKPAVAHEITQANSRSGMLSRAMKRMKPHPKSR